MKFKMKFPGRGELFDAQQLDAIKMTGQAAMAHRFGTIVDHNFGPGDGEDRPQPWPLLSKRYAHEFHGGDTTPTLQLHGALQGSITIQDSSLEFSEVYTENEYALIHQEGLGPVPARPFFPITEDGQVTDYAQQECLAAATKEIQRLVGGF